MKRRVFVFIFASLLLLSIIPIVNIVSLSDIRKVKWGRNFLYNIDFISKFTVYVLYPFGISIYPDKVIIGKNNWLFLGDQYERVLTDSRRVSNEDDFIIGQDIAGAIKAWDIYFSNNGIELFKIIIGPNKSSIYPENMPGWAKPSFPNPTDALLMESESDHYIDLRNSLISAKKTYQHPLYYKTDTHWNIIGAGVAFQEFARNIHKTTKNIEWPPHNYYNIVKIVQRSGGDLADFLRIPKYFSDSEPVTGILAMDIETVHFDFPSMKIVRKGGNPMIGPLKKPLLVRSKNSLNNKKVLWLRDSFGTALSPLMSATFSEVLQFSWAEAIKTPNYIVDIIEKWKPDYVFFTVVERSLRDKSFTVYPPPVFSSQKNKLKLISKTSIIRKHHISQNPINNEFEINGDKPFIDFFVSNRIDQKRANFLRLDLICSDGTSSIPLQLSWITEKQSNSDKKVYNSEQIIFYTEHNLLDLRTLPGWRSASAISHIRIKINAQNSCRNFIFNNPSFEM